MLKKILKLFTRQSSRHPLVTDNPIFIIEAEVNGDIGIAAHWKIPKSDEELTKVIHSFVAMLILLRNSDAFGVFQQSICEYAQKNNDIETARHIMVSYDKIMKTHAEHSEDGDIPIIGPTEAFK